MNIKIGTTLKCIEDTERTKKGDIIEIETMHGNPCEDCFSTNKDWIERYYLKSILGYKDSIGWNKKFVPYPKYSKHIYCRCFFNYQGLFSDGKVYSFKYKEIENDTFIEIISDQVKVPMYLSLDIFEDHFEIINERGIINE